MVGALEAAPLAGERCRITQLRIIVNEVTISINVVVDMLGNKQVHNRM